MSNTADVPSSDPSFRNRSGSWFLGYTTAVESPVCDTPAQVKLGTSAPTTVDDTSLFNRQGHKKEHVQSHTGGFCIGFSIILF